MAQSNTIPSNNTVLPVVPTTSSDFTETSPTIIKKAKDISRAKLKAKNRCGNQFTIEFPLILDIESSSNYLIKGFTPDADNAKWNCVDVCISIKGTGGGTTRATFRKCSTIE